MIWGSEILKQKIQYIEMKYTSIVKLIHEKAEIKTYENKIWSVGRY